MGELLRCYWHPLAAVAELDDRPTKPVKVLGEDLVLYKDRGGQYGLIDRRCPHRGFDLCYGLVEDVGLRCPYHGWRFDEQGSCLEQPFEDLAHPQSGFRHKVKTRAYPVKALSGLLWTYLGAEPVPPLPNWEPFSWENGFVHVFFSTIPCNWVQCQENSIDPVHFEWLHMHWLREQYGHSSDPRPPRHKKLRFDEFEFGFRYGRLVEGQEEDDEAWTIGRVCLWPNALYTGLNFSYRVPIDETSTLAVDWAFTPVPSDKLPFRQRRIPYSIVPLTDRQGQLLVGDIVHQDLMALVSQGTVADRTAEHLGPSDAGIVMLRKKLLSQARHVAAGGEPFGRLESDASNQAVPLPFMGRDYLLEHRPAKQEGYDRIQRSAIGEHIISGLSKETLESWTEVFGEPPHFHKPLDH